MMIVLFVTYIHACIHKYVIAVGTERKEPSAYEQIEYDGSRFIDNRRGKIER